MNEIYTFTYNGAPHLEPCYLNGYPDDAGFSNRPLLEKLMKDDFTGYVPMTSQGDPSLVHSTVFQDRSGQGGFVVMYNDEMLPMFCVICTTNLELMEAGAHFSEVVSNMRYGTDIFQTKMEG